MESLLQMDHQAISNSLLADECGHPSIIRNNVVAIKR